MEVVDPALFEPLELAQGLSAFAPEDPDAEMLYTGLRCPCGGTQFRLSGWLSVASGPGPFFWRTLTRFLREARQPTRVEECLDAPFKLPLCAHCEFCDRKFVILDHAFVEDRLPASERQAPQESLRCRACRRSQFELVAGVEYHERHDSPSAIELLSRCRSCHRQARVAWTRNTTSEQEVKLDLLYGRR